VVGTGNADQIDVPERKKDKHFEEDRTKFCLSEKDGEEYIRQRNSISAFMKKRREREQNQAAYERLARLKRLTAPEIKKLLASELDQHGYRALEFGAPELGKDVFLPFTVEDGTHTEHESPRILAKLLRGLLEEANWRLASEGISYRVGILSGRLHGYEREEDLLRIIQQLPKKPKPDTMPRNRAPK
jgi:hypothetical protein